MLVALLAEPPNVSGLPAHAWAPNTASTGVLVALADAGDWRALRLLALCLAVSLIASDNPATLRPWIRQLATVQIPRRSQPMPVWLIPPPPPLHLAPLLLRALAALQSSPSIRLAAERCGVSESTMARLLRTTRGVLGMPPGDDVAFPSRRAGCADPGAAGHGCTGDERIAPAQPFSCIRRAPLVRTEAMSAWAIRFSITWLLRFRLRAKRLPVV